MKCPWKRTLASVFLLLSSHNVRVLCQNVATSGQPPLPFIPDYARMNPGIASPQMNLMPGPQNVYFPEQLPLIPNVLEFQRIPEYIAPPYPFPQYNPIPQGNVGPLMQGPGCPPQINSMASSQGPIYNIPPNNNVPPSQGPPLNIPLPPLAPAAPNALFNIPPIQNIPPGPIPQGPLPNVSPKPQVIPQSPNLNIPLINSYPFLQGLPPPSITPVSLVQLPQCPIQPGPQVPIAPVSAPVLNPPPGPGLQNVQVFPLVSTSYPPPSLPAPNGPCTLTTDLTSVHFLPSPNIPSSLPIQNYAPQVVQPMMYSQPIIPIDCVRNAPVPNYQVSALPPVCPVTPVYDKVCDDIQSVSEEYTPVPINLHINVPSPTIPEPKITVITAYPPAPPPPVPVTSSEDTDVSFGIYPPFPLPPIIVEGRRSRSRNWLPLFLVALFASDGYYGGYGGGDYCCCCCPCGGDIPVPYPIPIPTNNPIILGNSCSTRKRGSKPKKE